MKRTREDFFFNIFAHTVLAIVAVLSVIPFWLLISASLSDETTTVASGYRFIPIKFSLDAYKYLFAQSEMILRAYGVTIFVTVVGTAISLLTVTLFAYGLTQKDVPGVNVIMVILIVCMLFNGGIVPSYYIYANVLHLKNTIFGLLIPGLLMNGFTVILVRSYINQSIPKELFEAAEIDGCNQFGIVMKIVFPLSTPILATVGLMAGLGYWNDWTNGLYYITNSNLYSVQQMLNEINNGIQFLASNAASLHITATLPSTTARMAIAVVAILPVLMVYPFFQKYFAKGIMLGAVKG